MNTPTRLFDFPRYQLENNALPNSLANKINGEWQEISTQEYVDMADKIARAVIDMGIEPGDKIALISATNRWEWNVMDIGILQAGAIDVPVYPTISEKDFEYIFNHAEVRLCFVSDKELYEKVKTIKDNVPTLEEVFVFEEVENAPRWTEVLERGEETTHQKELERRMEQTTPEDLATLIYTSGTTGTPKGVMLSHRNLTSNVLDSNTRIPTVDGARALSFLPVCHVYERMLIYLYCYNSIPIYFAESIDMVGENLREIKPEIFSAVPRLLEKMYDKIMSKGEELEGLKRNLFFWAVELGEEYELAGKSPWYKIRLAIARKLIFKKWLEALGGNVRAIVSGSAALNPRLIRIFMAAGFNIQEGYGLTETSPVIAVNGPTHEGKGIGTVGNAIPNVEVKIADDGEILCKGPNVMMGYYKNEEATSEVLEKDGWFHTGDIGKIQNGMLKITDRKKEIFKTSGGKYIAPQLMETHFKESRFIEQVMVIGDGEKHPAALIQPDFEFLKHYCEHKGISYNTSKEVVLNQTIIARIGKEVEKKNKAFGKWEQIKKFELCSEPWTIAGEELTPTLKLRRRVVLRKYAYLYEKIYGHPPQKI